MILGVIIVSQYVGVSFYLKQLMSNITSNNRKTGANFVKCWTVKLCIHVSKGPVMNQSKSSLFTVVHSKIHIQTLFTPVCR